MSIRGTLTTIKNFVVNLVTQQQEAERDQGLEGDFRSLGIRGRFWSSNSTSVSKKRTASNVFEPEITDDEDDNPGISGFRPGYNYPVSKRMRGESDWEMPYRYSDSPKKTPHKYVTRGSGVNPAIEGVEKQPWEFNFCKRRPNMPKIGCNGKDDGSDVAGSTSLGSDVNCHFKSSDGLRSEHLSGNMQRQEVTPAVPCSSQHLRNELRRNQSKTENSVRGYPNNELERKDVEVITLDDEPASNSSTSAGKVENNLALVPFSANSIVQKDRMNRLSKPMKMTKHRESSNFMRCFDEFQKRLRPKHDFSAYRLNEKQQYKKLLAAYSIQSTFDIFKKPLIKHKVGRDALEVMYSKNFESSPSGSVTIRKWNNIQANAEKSLLPRLYSTPNAEESVSLISRSVETPDVPVVIDLEAESQSSTVKQNISAISPIGSRQSSSFPTPGNSSFVGNYSNLEDALNNSSLPEEEQEKAEDEDISIIAEKVVQKSRNRTVNTLALEQTLCPYVDKRWLDDSKSSWREKQKHRENRIREEEGTIDVLRRESTLEKDLEEKIRKKLTLTEIIVLEEPPAKLPELTDEIWSVIEHAKARGNDNEVLAQVRLPKDTISITRGDIRTLGPSQWLNDNVINTYMGLIVLRSKLDNYPSVYAFQTFFYPKLLKEGYSNSLKRWTRKDDVFAHDLIILPIHLGLHWCLACIDFRKKTIRYFDSLGGDNNKCLHSLLDYISKEMKERKQMDLDKMEWKLENVKGIPQQENGSDCGMFACKFAEYLSRDSDFTFTQENMPYYRNRMIYELIKSDLLHP